MKTQMTDQERDALLERVTQALDVPEPSPLFWEHFPDRVRAAVAAAPPEPPLSRAWWRRPVTALALAASLVIAGGVWIARPGPSAPAAPASSDARGTGDLTLADDERWAIVSASAATAGVDALGEAGFGVTPGDADAALEDLTQAERAAFVAMLQAELKGSNAGGL